MKRLEAFIIELFGHEGSYQRDPNDNGNYHNGELYGTIWGISAKNHFLAFKKCFVLYKGGHIVESRNMAIEFYEASHYWNPLYDEINDSSLAYRLFDLGVNAGVSKAVRILQLTIKKYYDNDIKVDGIFGNQTLSMVNRFANYSAIPIRLHKIKTIPGENVFYAYYIHEIEKFYHSLSNFWKFGKGWLNRVRKVFNGAPDLYKIIKIK